MPATAQSLITQAYGLGYDALSERDLKEAMLATAAAGAGGGGGLSGTDAQTLINIACAMANNALSMRDILVCLAGLFAAPTSTTAQQAVVIAAANKYAALSDLQLDEGLLAVLS